MEPYLHYLVQAEIPSLKTSGFKCAFLSPDWWLTINPAPGKVKDND